jgi:hypothetical protein
MKKSGSAVLAFVYIVPYNFPHESNLSRESDGNLCIFTILKLMGDFAKNKKRLPIMQYNRLPIMKYIDETI